jgi:hypothetical protein
MASRGSRSRAVPRTVSRPLPETSGHWNGADATVHFPTQSAQSSDERDHATAQLERRLKATRSYVARFPDLVAIIDNALAATLHASRR